MRAHLRTFVLVAATGGLLALFLRQADLAQVWSEIRHASPLYLLLALLATLITYVFRALRWKALLLPLGRPPYGAVFRTTVIGFAANSLLPARAGEILRPYLLARQHRLSATSVFATVSFERLLDLVTVLAFFGCFVFLGRTARSADPGLFRTVQLGGLAAAAAATVGSALVFLVAGHPERLGRWAMRLEAFLPHRFASSLARAVHRFASGFAVVRRPAPLIEALVLSVPVWLSIAAGIWFVSLAFRIDMDFLGTFLIVTLLTVGVAVPTPGAVGGFHYAYRVGATVFFAAPSERAVGAAIVLHAISFVPVALLGLTFMLQDGLDLGRLKRMAADASQDPENPVEHDEVSVSPKRTLAARPERETHA
ncbi:MAG: lysylphosphatidylglycerol synthase transmembrane domain-containing protein [Vicinamibacterales bacterium]